jgi:phosphate transport system permease protein
VVKPETQVPRVAGQADVTQRTESDASPGAEPSPSAVRTYLLNCGSSSFADRTFSFLMLLCALSIFAIVLLILVELISGSKLSISKFGMAFFFGSAWDPVNGNFGALPFIYGTVVSSILSLIIAVPLAVGVAIFLTEMCPAWLRGFLAFFTELLAAIPSVVYGLWAVFVLIPLLRQYVNPFLIKTMGWSGIFAGPNYGIGMLAAGVILSIMILPIISSLTREVMSAVPYAQREAVLALGATRWEMIRMGVLRNARIGIVGAVILGLGRALGETMAVTMVIGNRPEIARSLLAPGYSMASVIANEFSEASDELYLSALIEIGLALFIVTIIVNALARVLVWAVTRGAPVRGT